MQTLLKTFGFILADTRELMKLRRYVIPMSWFGTAWSLILIGALFVAPGELQLLGFGLPCMVTGYLMLCYQSDSAIVRRQQVQLNKKADKILADNWVKNLEAAVNDRQLTKHFMESRARYAARAAMFHERRSPYPRLDAFMERYSATTLIFLIALLVGIPMFIMVLPYLRQ